ncbi:hypothetical protein [Dokdonia sp. Hel_I_53]|uniref:hypothetical protein n=1 Tax=Dokdonia sp. Hel_I_53 TaxID=1566287 RepID=UPI00119C0C8C|nr:hypothetical protein [Dokdonia sp. Hel_I_53]TVZ51739.1 hypothetical protein OD90_0891 [Dokdonia sp. Hel_I_53]
MEYSRAKLLLDKYFEGETNLTEEKQLRDYFSSKTVASELAEYTPLFCAFTKASELTYDIPFEEPRRKMPLKYAVSIAAVAVIAFALWIQGFHSQTDISTNYASDELAILKTKQALGVMSHMIANSTTQLEVVEEFDKASSSLFK